MGKFSIRTKITLALALPLLAAVIILGWGANRSLDTPDDDVRTFLFLGTLVILAAIFLAAHVIGRLVRPIEDLAADAQVVVDERLPALLERMRSGDASEALQLARLDVTTRDEVGQLAECLNRVQQATAGVAADQAALLSKGIGDLFVELSKRNQSLISRQIAFIDELEANEEDPDQLEALFHLDHLATRMQRNAESLLVLAGHEADGPTGTVIGIDDVVRIALGEVERFSRVSVGAMVEASVDGATAVDLAHLLSELLENATMYSPEASMVNVFAETNGADVAISIVDQGPGLSPTELGRANQLLAEPPLLGLTGAGYLGFNLVSRLARRIGGEVSLHAAGKNGLQAVVMLPGDRLLGAPRPVGDHSDESSPARLFESLTPAPAPTTDPEPVGGGDLPIRAPVEPTSALPSRPATTDQAPGGEHGSDTPALDAGPPAMDEPAPEPAPAIPETLIAPDPERSMVAEPEPAAALPSRTALSDDVFSDPDPFADVHTPVPTPGAETATAHDDGASSQPTSATELLAATGDENIDETHTEGGEPAGALVATGDRVADGAGAADHSPEALREMLSRYRTGRDKGRAVGPDDTEESR